MNKSFKKILVTGASLLMLASAGAGISNITDVHASRTVSLPSRYLGRWHASYDYGPKSAGYGKSVKAPITVTLGRRHGHLNCDTDQGPIVYTHYHGHYSWWPKGMVNGVGAGPAGQAFYMMRNGKMSWKEDVTTWHLYRTYRHHAHHYRHHVMNRHARRHARRHGRRSHRRY